MRVNIWPQRLQRWSVARICHPCSGGKRQNSWSGSSVSHCIGSKVVDLPLSRHSRDREEAQRQYKVDGHQWIKWIVLLPPAEIKWMGSTATATSRGKVKADKWISILSFLVEKGEARPTFWASY